MMSPRARQDDDETTGEESLLSGLSSISVQREIATLIDDFVAELESADRKAQRKRRRTGRLTAFRRRLKRYWGDPLDSLEELVATCAELGDQVAQAHQGESKLFLALELLRTRAIQVGWEVHALVSSGYADGAYARWRTLHELAVVSEFLQEFGEEVAARYLEHAHIKNRQIIREYNECQERLKYPRIPQSEVDHSESVKKQLLDRYGPEFGNTWGWAAKACGKSDPSFFDLRERTGYGHWKAHYGMANHPVHAGPHGVLFRLGHPVNSKPLSLSGPSLVGLGDPIDASAISLMHVTFAFVSAFRREDLGGVERELEVTALIKYISALAAQIGEQVEAASRHVEHKFGKHGAEPV